MIRFYRTPRFVHRCYPKYLWRVDSNDSIYLTFDDGPTEKVTPWVLEQLAKAEARATFFCLGKNLQQLPELAFEIKKRGHQIANHSFSHPKGSKTESIEYVEDVWKCDEVLSELGIEGQYFRPPYGRLKRRQASLLKDKQVVMWSHLSWDFDGKADTNTSIRKLKSAKPGSILTFHDSEKAFDQLQVILPELLSHFKSRGLNFKTLEQ